MLNSAAIVAEVREELGRSPELWYAHRLDAILLIGQGLPYRVAAMLLADQPRTVARWWRSYRLGGVAGVRDGPRGRHRSLTDLELQEIADRCRNSAIVAQIAGGAWTGKLLADWIEKQYGVRISERHARRLLHAIRGQSPPNGDSGGPRSSS